MGRALAITQINTNTQESLKMEKSTEKENTLMKRGAFTMANDRKI